MRLNLAGYKFLPFDGYGRMTLKSTQALLRNGHEVYPFDIRELERPAWFLQAQGLEFDRVTVQWMPPDMMKPVPGRSTAMTMHESMTLPPGWAEAVNNYNEFLMVPCPLLVEVFRDGGVKIPIEVVKSGIDPDECPITIPNKNRPFTFGCLADRGSRKGHQDVYSAFYKAFDYHNHDVRLVMKCRPGSLKRLDFSYSNDMRVKVWRADVDNIADIFAPFDAFMFPTKFEGWGQPCREAAACGVPTVVTRFSGTDDETEKWAIPLEKYTMVESGMLGCGGDWAQPDEEELIYWMRWLVANRDQARTDALKRAQWLRDNRTYAQAADNLVRTMSKWMGGPLAAPDYVPDQASIMATRQALSEIPEFITGVEDDAIATPRKKVRANGHLKEVVR